MDTHFILNLPENLANELRESIKNNELSDVKIECKNKTIKYVYKNISYESIFYDIPTIIEAQKTIDKKQFYKSIDISNCLYVFDTTKNPEEEIQKFQNEFVENNIHDDFNGDIALEEKLLNNHILLKKSDEYKKILKNRLELSGLSQSLKYAKLRYFKKKNEKIKMMELRDKKVNELIEREKMSDSITIQFANEEYVETEDLSSLVAEFDNNQIEQPIDTRFYDRGIPKIEFSEKIGMKNIPRSESNVRMDESIISENEADSKRKMELVEEIKILEEKIKKKGEQLASVTNMILERRFRENLISLNDEVDKKRKDLENLNYKNK